MGKRPYPRNQACPCGSGRKYKSCCYTKGFHYLINEETDEVLRAVPLDNEADEMLQEVLQSQRDKFVAQFGREPGPEDRVFFDVDEDDTKEKTVEVMRKVGIRPALIYAYEQTGLLVTEENKSLIPDRDLEEFEAAVYEFYALHPEQDPDRD